MIETQSRSREGRFQSHMLKGLLRNLPSRDPAGPRCPPDSGGQAIALFNRLFVRSPTLTA